MAQVPEVMACYDFNQLQPNESQDQCGYAAVALCFAAGPPGTQPRQPVQWAIQMMASWYTEYNGADIPSNTKGMTLDQLYRLIVEKGGHYQAIDPHAASIASWIEAKYPVIVAVQESSVFDVHLNACPYTWNTAGLSHIFTITGIDHDHIFLCRDTVNQHDGSPYSYDGDKLAYLSATVFVPDWLPRPTSAIAPTQPSSQGDTMLLQLSDPMGQFFTQVSDTHWHCNPNNVDLVFANLDFYRQYGGIFGLPRTNEVYLSSMPGTAIVVYERAVAIYDPGRLAKNEAQPGAGQVYLMLLNGGGTGIALQQIAKPLVATLQAEVSQLQAQLANGPTVQLQAQVAAYQAAIKQVDEIVHSFVTA